MYKLTYALALTLVLSGCTTWPIDESGVGHFYERSEVVRTLCPPEHFLNATMPCHIPATFAQGEVYLVSEAVRRDHAGEIMCIEGNSRLCAEAVCNFNSVGPGMPLTDACMIAPANGTLDLTRAIGRCSGLQCLDAIGNLR